jgi:hypothetical protein
MDGWMSRYLLAGKLRVYEFQESEKGKGKEVEQNEGER